jgi:hypothetical protein
MTIFKRKNGGKKHLLFMSIGFILKMYGGGKWSKIPDEGGVVEER